jgi:cellulose synthase/poly-beta-1,6-N-acetylglucosamine synthase-like glycosyltransferase
MDNQGLPDISVVVPVYNAKRTIRACVESLLAQDYPKDRYEIIVVDNNCTDGTDTIVAEYPVTLLHEREIQTSYAARNRGIQHARGSVVAFTDADCVAAPSWLREIAAPFTEQAVGGVGGRVLGTDPQTDVEKFLCSMQLFSHYHEDSVYLPVLLTSNAAYRRTLLLAIGAFNGRLFTASDVDLAWRLQLETGARVVYAPTAVIYHTHRSTLKSMARQFRRHGFGEILLDAMYKDHAGYQRTPRRQLRRIGKQILAMLTYVRSIAYRSVVRLIRDSDREYVLSPCLHLVAECNNVYGKLQGLWATRFFRRNPASGLWENRWER